MHMRIPHLKINILLDPLKSRILVWRLAVVLISSAEGCSFLPCQWSEAAPEGKEYAPQAPRPTPRPGKNNNKEHGGLKEQYSGLS